MRWRKRPMAVRVERRHENHLRTILFVALVAMLGASIAAISQMAYILTFTVTTFGGILPFIVLSAALPLGMMAGFAIAKLTP